MSGPRGSRAPEVGGLGRKVEKPTFQQDEYEPVPGRPYWWKHRTTGFLKYAPPTPSP